jgi:hypothetical protein
VIGHAPNVSSTKRLENGMKKSRGFVIAVLLAASASAACAQIGSLGGSFGGGLTSGAGPGAPFAINPYGSSGNLGLGSTGPLFSPGGGGVSGSAGLRYSTPGPATSGSSITSPLNSFASAPMANPLSPGTRYPLVDCHPGGCSGSDGTQYTAGAGNVMLGSNGKICQYMAAGAPLVCN